MSILVVCPGCKKSFQVSDKFAGKTGPCPKCKTVIRVPTKAEEVQVHAPEEFGTGGRGATGQLALKPIARSKFVLKPVVVGAIVGAIVLVIVLTLVGRWLELFQGATFGAYAIRAIGLLIVSPALAIAAYTFLRDDELEPYRGIELYVRAAICAVIYMSLWGGFVYAKGLFPPVELWQWFIIAPPFFIVGAVAGWLSFDIEASNGFFHYAFYVLVTVLLGALGGLGWVWQ